MSLNLQQARAEEIARSLALLEQAERGLAGLRGLQREFEGYKVRQFFHGCQPGCHATSPRVADHVPLPGRARPTCRILYGPHLQFFRAGAKHRERVFLAANRIGKTEAAAYETRHHLTGLYPDWWEGRRFEEPVRGWVAGDTRQTTRDIPQVALMGPYRDVEIGQWSGMIDPNLILDVARASGGVKDCLDTVYVHWRRETIHGGPAISELGFRSYDQGRRAFQGTSQHLIWLDEEPPLPSDIAESQAEGSSEIWTECALRTMATSTMPSGGILYATFTPLHGMTPLLKQYIETAVMPGTEPDEEIEAKSRFFEVDAA